MGSANLSPYKQGYYWGNLPDIWTFSDQQVDKHGVLIKGGALLEELGRIDAVLFDKTGTLTTGEPVVEKIVAFSEHTKDSLLALAASAEKYSEHPVAKAILNAAQAANCILSEPENFRQLVGKGIDALVDGKTIFVGRCQGDGSLDTFFIVWFYLFDFVF